MGEIGARRPLRILAVYAHVADTAGDVPSAVPSDAFTFPDEV